MRDELWATNLFCCFQILHELVSTTSVIKNKKSLFRMNQRFVSNMPELVKLQNLSFISLQGGPLHDNIGFVCCSV